MRVMSPAVSICGRHGYSLAALRRHDEPSEAAKRFVTTEQRDPTAPERRRSPNRGLPYDVPLQRYCYEAAKRWGKLHKAAWTLAVVVSGFSSRLSNVKSASA